MLRRAFVASLMSVSLSPLARSQQLQAASILNDGPGAPPNLITQLPFPAVGVLSSPTIEDNDPYLFGGHSLGQWDTDTGSCIRVWSDAQRTVAGGVSLGSSQFIVYGAQDHELGWVALLGFGALEAASNEVQELWHVAHDVPFTARATLLNTSALSGENILLGDESGRLHLLSLETRKMVWTSAPHTKLVTATCLLSPTLAASADWAGNIELFDPTTGHSLDSFKQHRDAVTQLLPLSNPAQSNPAQSNPTQPNLTPAKQAANPVSRLVSCSRDGTVRLWYPEQRRMVRFIQLQRPVVAIASLAENQPESQNQLLIATDDAQVHRVDLSQAKLLSSTPSGLDSVTAIVPTNQNAWLLLDGRGNARLHAD